MVKFMTAAELDAEAERRMALEFTQGNRISMWEHNQTEHDSFPAAISQYQIGVPDGGVPNSGSIVESVLGVMSWAYNRIGPK